MFVYLQNNENDIAMTITVKINASTPEGKHLVEELRRYPETVEFIESTVVSEPTTATYIPTKKSISTSKKNIKTISASESAKLAFQKLGEKYNRTFENKYTR